MRLLIVGAPGAGKGTQATRIAEHVGIPTISTGAIFRAEMASGSELGQQVKQIMDSGELVSDEITDEIVSNRLKADDVAAGWLLDGYPRKLSQVAALDTMLDESGQSLDAVVSLVVDPEQLVTRLLDRAEKDGRSDDNEQTIRNRMKVYANETEPLLAVYRERGLLEEIDGVGSVDEVSKRIFAVLDELAGA
ncbi:MULTISPECIES: adenylate kinase [Aestuariimicrobium]|uniref:adenylate kinase n=1 Tax=Aestuariimicrobium TaxID=396388 RepID=UPI0003B46358|nr:MULTISPECIES: adenylate kinase [Aestuariimicrobium]CAI9406634.1 Adenylate kinase [Aestuariimicrobium sp. T2.26MG-19.2B]